MRSWTFVTLLLAACTTADPTDDDTDETDVETDDTDVAPTTGRLAIRFSIDPFVEEAMPEGEEPIGTFHGSIWNADDVTVTGPVDGAVDLEGLEAELDLVAADPSPVLITSGELDAGYVRILGFLDADGNATDAPDPDDKDPVTLPEQNEFEVIAGETTEITVLFGLLNP